MSLLVKAKIINLQPHEKMAETDHRRNHRRISALGLNVERGGILVCERGLNGKRDDKEIGNGSSTGGF